MGKGKALNRMKLTGDIEIMEDKNSVFLRDIGAIVCSDLHIGYEQALHEMGVTLPASQYPLIKKEIEETIEIYDPDTIIINGDLKHEFGEATRQEWREVLDLLSLFSSRKIGVKVVRGNHDNYLIPILKKTGVEFHDPSLSIGKYLFFHGHRKVKVENVEGRTEIMIIGHEHPAIAIRDELGITNKYKCLLEANYKQLRLIVLPAMSPIMPGSEVNFLEKNQLLSPILREDELELSRATIVEGGLYSFPFEELRTTSRPNNMDSFSPL